MTQSETYWDKVGSDWNLVGPPLRPCAEDTAIMEQMVDRWCRTACVTAPQAVILGVTEEIVGMKWPGNTHILAFDREPARVQSLWPHHSLSNAAALCSNWLALPLVDGCADLVLADGSLTLLKFPEEYQQLAQELARILAPGGIVVVRLYVAPDHPESVDDVFRELWAGNIVNFNAFKWRLAMALIEKPDYSSSFNDVWEAWHTNMHSDQQLAESLGWPLPVIRMIERYCGCDSTRNSYPPVDKIRDIFAPQFRQVDMQTPSYQDGERYPTVCFQKVMTDKNCSENR